MDEQHKPGHEPGRLRELKRKVAKLWEYYLEVAEKIRPLEHRAEEDYGGWARDPLAVMESMRLGAVRYSILKDWRRLRRELFELKFGPWEEAA